jgi:hypothetical protein
MKAAAAGCPKMLGDISGVVVKSENPFKLRVEDRFGRFCIGDRNSGFPSDFLNPLKVGVLTENALGVIGRRIEGMGSCAIPANLGDRLGGRTLAFAYLAVEWSPPEGATAGFEVGIEGELCFFPEPLGLPLFLFAVAGDDRSWCMVRRLGGNKFKKKFGARASFDLVRGLRWNGAHS